MDECENYENMLFNKTEDPDESEKIKSFDKQYSFSLNIHNNKRNKWNTDLSENKKNLEGYLKDEFPNLIEKMLNDSEKIFKNAYGSKAVIHYDSIKKRLVELSKKNRKINNIIIPERNYKEYSLSNPNIVNSSEYKSKFKTVEVHNIISKIRSSKCHENSKESDKDYESGLEQTKAYTIDYIKIILDQHDNIEYPLMYNKYGLFLIDKCNNEDIARHILDYLNFSRNYNRTNTEKHSFVILGEMFESFFSAGYNPETGKMNHDILKKMFLLSETFFTYFIPDVKTYIMEYLKNKDGFKNIQFWNAYLIEYIKGEAKVLDKNISFDKKIEEIIKTKYIGLIKTVVDFEIPKDTILSLNDKLFSHFSKLGNDTKMFITTLIGSMNKTKTEIDIQSYISEIKKDFN